MCLKLTKCSRIKRFRKRCFESKKLCKIASVYITPVYSLNRCGNDPKASETVLAVGEGRFNWCTHPCGFYKKSKSLKYFTSQRD